jgi:hypothetical protein
MLDVKVTEADRPFGKRFSVSAFQQKRLSETLNRSPKERFKNVGGTRGILKRETLAHESGTEGASCCR